MSVLKKNAEAVYQKYARNYDLVIKFYRLIGLHIEDYREHAVDLLNLKQGDCVLDLGCGTGLNFPHILKKIGPEGRLIGVDFSSEMLACAKERIKRSSWENVQLVHSDIAAYNFPSDINGVISTGVFGYLDERNRIIEKISHILEPEGRLAIIDGKHPSRWPSWLFKLFIWLSSPYGVTEDYFNSDTRELVERYFQNITYKEVYGGLIFILAGSASLTNT